MSFSSISPTDEQPGGLLGASHIDFDQLLSLFNTNGSFPPFPLVRRTDNDLQIQLRLRYLAEREDEFNRQMAECFHEEVQMSNATLTIDDKNLQYIKQISYGIVLTVICSFGIVGNLLNLIVLTRQRFNAIMYIYLRWMAFADLNAAFFVIIYIIRNGWEVISTNILSAYYYAHLAVPIINTFLVTSSLMVVIVTVERYLSTCHPIKSRQLVTPFRAKTTACFAYLVSFFLYIPMAFEFQVKAVETPAVNFFSSNRTTVQYHPCYNKEYADSYLYASIYKTMQVTITKFIPIVTIIILNILTLVRFKKIMERHHALTNKSKREKKQFDEEYRLTVMLICVVLVYIVCLVPNTLAWLIRSSDKQKQFSFQVFIIVADLLEVVNSSLNFYMYCMGSADFRKHFRNTFCPAVISSAKADPRSEFETTCAASNTAETPLDRHRSGTGNGSVTVVDGKEYISLNNRKESDDSGNKLLLGEDAEVAVDMPDKNTNSNHA